MNRQQLLDQALQTIDQLPDERISEVIDFASFMLKKHEETALQKGIEQLVETSEKSKQIEKEAALNINFKIPNKDYLLSRGYPMYIAPKGDRWTKDCLRLHANKRGVYVHHNSNEVLYIGQTVKGKWGTFSERLRREFQETSSQNSRLHKFLTSKAAGGLYTVCFDFDDIEFWITETTSFLSNENKALAFEQILIGHYNPEGNRNGVFQKVERGISL